MVHLQRILYGPIWIVWRHSRVVDHSLVVAKLRLALPEGTQVFGVQEPCCHCGDGCYTYKIVLWPDELEDLTEIPRETGDLKSKLQEVVTELHEIGSKSRSGYAPGAWIVRCFGETKQNNETVQRLLEEMYRCLEKKTADSSVNSVLFGEMMVEYEAHGHMWHEVHSATVGDGYVRVMEKI